MERAEILIVDDDPISVEIIAESLVDADYELDTAAGGEPAWSKLEAGPERYNAVVLDRKMPDLDGLALLARIKAHPILAAIPVVMVTSAGKREEVLEGLEAGAYYYLIKPFDIRMLRPIVDSAVTDHLRYQFLREQQKKGARVCGLMQQGYFRFRSVEEANNLAVFLSNACPLPESAVTGLAELLINAVEHGNLGVTYDEKSKLMQENLWPREIERRLSLPENRGKFVEVFFESRDDEISIRIRDQGRGFDWEPFLEIDPDRAFDSHGRGIAMARILSFHTLEYVGCGNEVRVTAPRATGLG